MDTQTLKDHLQQLRHHLESGAPIDAETRSLLLQLDADIHHAITRRASGEPHDSALVERAREASAQLSAQHPVLDQVMRQLADTLGKMGI